MDVSSRRRIDWSIASLLLLRLSAADRPYRGPSSRGDGSASKRFPNDLKGGSSNISKRRRFQHTDLCISGKRNSSFNSSRGSRDDEPRLPDYPFEEVSETRPKLCNDRVRPKFDVDFDDPTPFSESQRARLAEPDNDVDSIWSLHETVALDETDVETAHEDHEEELAHSPIVYQYFGRSRSRVHTADSIPFILLGPKVEHWKIVGQTMASRGFSVMACELAEDNDKGRRTQAIPEEGKNLILAVLDALRWNKSILVGCDSEAAMVIEAAIQLAPDRVAGLVLCGDLSAADRLAREMDSVDTEQWVSLGQKQQTEDKSHLALDSILSRMLACPYTIVWDGDVEESPSPPTDSSSYSIAIGDMFSFNRCLILGGGTAPHRRVPEQFAWALTRFVEEKVAPRSVPLTIQSGEKNATQKIHRFAKRGIPRGIDEFFSPGSMLVMGRIIASVLFYVTAVKIAVYQYDSLRGGVIGIHSLVQCLRAGKQHLFHSVGSFVRNYGYIFSLFRREDPSDVEEICVVNLEKETTVADVDDGVVEEPSDNDIEHEQADSVDSDADQEDIGETDNDSSDEEPDAQQGEDEAEADKREVQADEPEGTDKPQLLRLLDLVVV